MKNKNAQPMKDSFENNLISSTRKPNLIETDRKKRFYKIFFKTSWTILSLKYIPETAHSAVFKQKDLIELLEIL